MSTEPAIRAVIIDDHKLLAQSLAVALEMEGLPCLVADLGDRDELVRSVVAARPDLVLLDLDLGGAVGDGETLVPAFVAAGARVLVVSAATDPEQISHAIELGAAGVLSKAVPFDQLLQAALAVAHGEEVLSRAERRRLFEYARAQRTGRAAALAPFRSLTSREAQVLRALADGVSVGAIAAGWFVSEATVRSQVRGVLNKLGVTSQLEAVGGGHRCGWLGTGGDTETTA